jgi:tetratricopeptide (TPR) repeat protein
VQLYRVAADYAAQRSAWNETIAHLRRALDVLPIQPDRRKIPLFQLIAVTMIRSRGYAHPDTIATWEQVRQASIFADDVAGLGAGLLGLGTAHYVAAEFGAACELIDRALAIAVETNAEALEVACHTVQGNIAFFRGRFRESLEQIERSIALYDPATHHDQLVSLIADDSGVTAWAMSGWVLHRLGSFGEALHRVDRAVELAVALRDPYTVAQARLWRLALLVERGDPLAEDAAHDLLDFTTEQGFVGFGGGARMYVGQLRSDVDEIVAGAMMARTTGTKVMGPAALGSLGRAQLARGAFADAIAMADAGLENARSTDQHYVESSTLCTKAAALLAINAEPTDDDLAAAERIARQAISVAILQEAPLYELRATTLLARILLKRGRADDGLQLLERRYPHDARGDEVQDLRDAREALDQLRAATGGA